MAISDMIELMMFVALAIGLLFSILMFRRFIGVYLSVFSFMSDSSKERFMAIYDLMDDETSYKFMMMSSVKSYADYLRLHKKARKNIYKDFRYYYGNIQKQLLTRNLPILVLPAILFWSNWYWYLLGTLIGILALISYEYIVRNHRTGFYQRVMLNTLLEKHLKDDQ